MGPLTVLEPRRSGGTEPFGAAYVMTLGAVTCGTPSGSVAHATRDRDGVRIAAEGAEHRPSADRKVMGALLGRTARHRAPKILREERSVGRVIRVAVAIKPWVAQIRRWRKFVPYAVLVAAPERR